jgi:hypothetical protein
VRLLDQLLHLLVGAEMRVDPGEVGDPVAVVAGGGVRAGALDGTVLERRGDPDRGAAEVLDVVEPAEQPFEVAAVVEALVRGVEAGAQGVASQPAPVVAPVAVGEPVGHGEVEAFPRQVRAQRVPGEVPVRGLRRTAQR